MNIKYFDYTDGTGIWKDIEGAEGDVLTYSAASGWVTAQPSSSTPDGQYDVAMASGSVTVTGTTPTGTPNHRYSYEVAQNSRLCQAHLVANWPNAGAGITVFTIALPDGMPTPLLMNGISGANANVVPCFAILQTALTTETTARGILKVKSGGSGYEIEITASSGSYRIANVFLSYFIALT